jgi:hypothetical protein
MIWILSIIALPGLLAAKESASAASAIGSMRAISSAQLTYALTCGGGFYAPSLTTLGTAPPGAKDSFIGGGLGSADMVTKGGYIIRMSATPFAGSPTSCNGLAVGAAGQAFVAAADPANSSNTRFFATNANGTIYEYTSSLFGLMPEVGNPPVGHPLSR